MKKLLLFVMMMAVAFTFSGVGWVTAQESGSGEFELEEITVTATKREENVQKIAATMDVITGAEMLELGMNDVNEILSNISSALITKGYDGMKVSLRGISQDGQPFGGLQTRTPTVALNVDGVYSNRNSSGQNLFDIERVEVLMGPHSTLYASATPGGIVNIITADPTLDTYEAKGVVEYGNYELLHMEGALNAPVGDTLAVRAAFSTTVRDGYLSNGAEDEDSKVARLKLKWEPTDNFSIVATGEVEKSTGQGFSGVALFVDQDDVDDPWVSDQPTPRDPRLTDRKKLYAQAVWDTGIGELTMVPSMVNKDFQTSDFGFFFPLGTDAQTVTIGETKERGMEARMTSPEESPIVWIVGFNYYTSEEVIDNTITPGGGDDTLLGWAHRYVDTTSLAIFGNVTYPLTDRFRVSAGLRWTDDDTTWYNGEDPRPPGKPFPEISIHAFDNLGGKVGFEYDLSDDSMIYADITTGHRVVGSGTDRNFNPLPPEEIFTYNIGSKNRFLDNRLQVNASAFYYDYTDQIAVTGVRTLLDENGNGIRDFIDNNGNGVFDSGVDEYTENRTMLDEGAKQPGNLEVYGFDLMTSTILTPKDKLDLSISYVKKTWSELLFDFWDITNSLGIADLDYSGNVATFAPEWTVNVSYEHTFALPNGGQLLPRYDARYQSDYTMYFLDTLLGLDRNTLEPTFTPVNEAKNQEAYVYHDLSLVYTSPDGKWTLTGYVKNLTDYAVKKQIRVTGSGGTSQLMLGPPRTYGAVLSVRF